jgi:hypothetical protein
LIVQNDPVEAKPLKIVVAFSLATTVTALHAPLIKANQKAYSELQKMKTA